MEFGRICKEWKRMHETVPNCNACPLSLVNNKTGKSCNVAVRDFPETAKEIIMKWSAENPIITNAMKFKEVFGYDFQDAFGALGCSEWLDDKYEKGKQYD